MDEFWKDSHGDAIDYSMQGWGGQGSSGKDIQVSVGKYFRNAVMRKAKTEEIQKNHEE